MWVYRSFCLQFSELELLNSTMWSIKISLTPIISEFYLCYYDNRIKKKNLKMSWTCLCYTSRFSMALFHCNSCLSQSICPNQPDLSVLSFLFLTSVITLLVYSDIWISYFVSWRYLCIFCLYILFMNFLNYRFVCFFTSLIKKRC